MRLVETVDSVGNMTGGRRALAAAFSALLAATGAARADVVSAQGRPIAVGVQITAFRNGQLAYRTAGEQEISRGIEQIRYLQVSGWETFNNAEKERRDGKAALAIAGYEQCLEALGTTEAAGPVDRRLLVQCRLVRLYEAQGQFDRAVAAYLEVIDEMPAALETLRPGRVAKPEPSLLRTAAGLVDKAIARRDRLDPVAASLEKWRATWPEMSTEEPAPAATRPAGNGLGALPQITTRRAATNAAFAPVVAELRGLVEKGRFEQAVERVAALKKVPDTFFGFGAPAELYYWEGRARLGMAGRKKDKEAQVELRRAGLALMRVVIHWPESPLAAECLYRAGEICRDDGQLERAAELWGELIAAYPAAGPWGQQARGELARVRATASGPAR